MAKQPRSAEFDNSMASRAAWLHYAGGLTQAEVAKRLGLSSVKAHRLITRANQEGMVKIFVEGDVAECVALEDELSRLFDLEHCEVVPEFDLDPLPLRALGLAGAQFLRRSIDNNEHALIGVGHGRTLASCVDHLPVSQSASTDFVSLIGGFTRTFSANPHDVIHRLAERTGCSAFVVPVPFFANTEKDRELLLAQPGISEVFELARTSSLKLVGIGSSETEASIVATGMIDSKEIRGVNQAGGVGELLGHFFDQQGNPVNTPLTARTMTLSLRQLQDSKIIAVAGGKQKTRAIRSVLKSRFLSGLITDECSARALVSNVNDANS